MRRLLRIALPALVLVAGLGAPELFGEDEAAAGPGLAQAVADVHAEIRQAREELAARREEISKRRIELDRRVDGKAAEIRRLRDEWEEKSRLEDAERAERDERKARAAKVDDAIATTRTLVREVRRNLEAELSLPDSVAASDRLEELDRRLAASEDPASLAAAAKATLTLLGDHLEAAETIRRSRGEAVAPDGRSESGTFVQIGDLLGLFAPDGSADGAGIVTLMHGSPLPHVFTDLGTDAREAIARAAEGEEASVPLDVTGGAALKTRKARPSLVEQFLSGGVVMWPILGIAIAGLAIGLFKLVELMRVRTDFEVRVSRFADLEGSGATASAEEYARAAPRPLRRVLVAAADHRSASREEFEEVLNEAVLAEVPPLERRLSVLAVGAAIAPLLGLLGTVTGMIHTFRLISVFGTGDPRLLSAGISEALVTTEAGLVVAIPLLLFHAFLSRRVHRVSEGLDTAAVSLLNRLRTTKAKEAVEP